MSVKVHEAYCLDSQQHRLLWWDDFLGDQIQDEWNAAGTGSVAVVDQQTGGIVRLTTGATSTDTYQIDWNNIRSLLISKKISIEFRAKISTTTNIHLFYGLWKDGNELIYFKYSTGDGDITWRVVTNDATGPTDNDSGVAIDASYHIFRIECHTHGSNHVHFYIDGTETNNSPTSTDLPSGQYLQPIFWIRTLEDLAKSMDVDYVVVRQEI